MVCATRVLSVRTSMQYTQGSVEVLYLTGTAQYD
jgi:hypothetical protein